MRPTSSREEMTSFVYLCYSAVYNCIVYVYICFKGQHHHHHSIGLLMHFLHYTEQRGTYGATSNIMLFFLTRNCLVGASYHIKISDCAMFRPAFKKDYFQSDRDVLPLRWIPWEVHVMVRLQYILHKICSDVG